MKKETAIELIIYAFENSGRSGFAEWFRENKDALLKKEKAQITLAYFDGVEKAINKDAVSPQEYFNQTYNNQ